MVKLSECLLRVGAAFLLSKLIHHDVKVSSEFDPLSGQILFVVVIPALHATYRVIPTEYFVDSTRLSNFLYRWLQTNAPEIFI